MKKLHVKVGDQVQVIAGKEKGKSGKVTRVFVNQNRVVVEGLNTAKKHVKPTQGKEGGVIDHQLPIHASNVLLLDPKTNKPTRTGMKRIEPKGDKKPFWARVSRKSGTVFDQVKG